MDCRDKPGNDDGTGGMVVRRHSSIALMAFSP